MVPFEPLDKKEVDKINELQRELFDELYQLFEPPLPDEVPERLERIVEAGNISAGDNILDIGSGTGILIPIIKKYNPACIYACDLSEKMLEQLQKNYPYVKTFLADICDLRLPDSSVGVAFLNACYPNIVDKTGAFSNIRRMIRPSGGVVISHPLGKDFILSLKKRVPFPLDEFPTKQEAAELFGPFGLEVEFLIDEPELYILKLKKGDNI